MELIKNNKMAFGGASVVALGILGWLAFGFFGIQAAFIDDVVDEGGPVFAAPAPEEPVIEADAPDAQVTETADATEPAAPIQVEPAVEEAEVPSAIASVDDPVEQAAPEAQEPVEPAASPDAAATEPEPAAAPPEPAPEPAAAPEPEPAAEPEPEPVAEQEATATPGEIVTLSSGNFQGINNYAVSGDALVLNNGTEQRFLRFENFASDNGPDLKVYLRAANGDFISLGDLSGNIGDQNYEIPVDVDLEVFNQVEIWCERFARGFGEAVLG